MFLNFVRSVACFCNHIWRMSNKQYPGLSSKETLTIPYIMCVYYIGRTLYVIQGYLVHISGYSVRQGLSWLHCRYCDSCGGAHRYKPLYYLMWKTLMCLTSTNLLLISPTWIMISCWCTYLLMASPYVLMITPSSENITLSVLNCKLVENILQIFRLGQSWCDVCILRQWESLNLRGHTKFVLWKSIKAIFN